LAHSLATGGPKQENAKLCQKGPWRGHVANPFRSLHPPTMALRW